MHFYRLKGATCVKEWEGKLKVRFHFSKSRSSLSCVLLHNNEQKKQHRQLLFSFPSQVLISPAASSASFVEFKALIGADFESTKNFWFAIYKHWSSTPSLFWNQFHSHRHTTHHIDDCDWLNLAQLGSSVESRVWEGKERETRERYAVKMKNVNWKFEWDLFAISARKKRERRARSIRADNYSRFRLVEGIFIREWDKQQKRVKFLDKFYYFLMSVVSLFEFVSISHEDVHDTIHTTSREFSDIELLYYSENVRNVICSGSDPHLSILLKL